MKRMIRGETILVWVRSILGWRVESFDIQDTLLQKLACLHVRVCIPLICACVAWLMLPLIHLLQFMLI